VGLSGLGKRIGEMIGQVRGMVDRALTWLVDKAVNAGTGLLNMGKSAVSALKSWWKKRKKLKTKDGHDHEISFKGTGNSARVVIASEKPGPYIDFINAQQKQYKLAESDVSAARAMAVKIDKERASSDKEDEKAAKIDKYFNELVTLTAAIPIPAGAGSTSPVYGPIYEANYGSLTKVERIGKDKLNKGTEADSSKFTDNYRALNVRRQGKGSYYVRGHLLSWRLGGPGKDWKNLTPLYQNVNGHHEDRFEKDLKNALANGKTIEKFEVQAIYGRTPSPQIENLKKDGKVEGLAPTADRSVVSTLLKAELKVPTKLLVKANVIDKKGKSTSVNPGPIANDISYGKLDQYSFADTPPKTVFNLSEAVGVGRDDVDKDMAKANLIKLTGITDDIAEKIYERVKVDKKVISNYKEQIGISKNELEIKNSRIIIKQ